MRIITNTLHVLNFIHATYRAAVGISEYVNTTILTLPIKRNSTTRTICRKLCKMAVKNIHGFLTSARDDFYQTVRRKCVGARREGLFSRAARKALNLILNLIYDVTELAGIQRVEITINGFRVFPRIFRYGQHFFFLLLLILSHRLGNQLLRHAKITTLRETNDRHSFEIGPFISFSRFDTGNHIFIAHRPSRSKTYNNQILFVKTRCNFASISPKEKEKSNSIDICLNFTNLSTSLRISSNIVLNAVITFFKNFKTFNFLRFRWQVITREENRGKNGSGGSGEIATLLTGFPAQREFFSRCFEKKKI